MADSLIDLNYVHLVVAEVAHLETQGDYDSALYVLRDFLPDISSLPNVDGLPTHLAAEMVLRCGAVVGYLGGLKQIKNAQDHSKNLLTDARQRFTNIYKVEKIAECEVFLAMAYYRTGEFGESEIWITEALQHSIADASPVKLHAHLIKIIILLNQQNYTEALDYSNSVKNLFENATHYFIGSFYTNLGLVFKNLHDLEKAEKCFLLAQLNHEKSNHKLYLATVHNNLAQVYKIKNDFESALNSAEQAIELFRQLGDRSRTAFSIDTKAQILIASGRFQEAVNESDNSIIILERGEDFGMLADALFTKAVALAHSENLSDAILCLSDSIQITKTQSGEEKAKQFSDDFYKILCKKFPVKVTKIFEQSLSKKRSPDEIILDLPTEIKIGQNFHAVWIKNNDFKEFGLQKDDLAIISEEIVTVGDFAAVLDNQTDLVSFGFYDFAFELICLEDGSDEPELFDASSAQILGKVVGFCHTENKKFGRFSVKPIMVKRKADD